MPRIWSVDPWLERTTTAENSAFQAVAAAAMITPAFMYRTHIKAFKKTAQAQTQLLQTRKQQLAGKIIVRE